VLRALGFDLDGTLFDHRGSVRAGLQAFARSLGVIMTPTLHRAWLVAEQKHFEAWRAGLITFEEQRRRRLRDVLPVMSVQVPSSDQDLDLLFGRYLRAYESAWRAYDDVVGVLRRLRHEGMVLGVLTNGSAAQQRAKLERTGLAPLLDVICVSEEIGAAKPEPAAFWQLTEALGVVAGQTGFVGDDPAQDVDGARAAGLAATLITRGDAAEQHALDTAVAGLINSSEILPRRRGDVVGVDAGPGEKLRSGS
jgi:putative hydrolase of the HAD superfamily